VTASSIPRTESLPVTGSLPVTESLPVAEPAAVPDSREPPTVVIPRARMATVVAEPEDGADVTAQLVGFGPLRAPHAAGREVFADQPGVESPLPAVELTRSRRGPLLDLVVSLPLALSVLVLMAWNIDGFPGASDDEGTYLSQAWAVRHGLGLAHYTYWYDHPPLGWIQLALLSWVPALADPTALAIGAGRIAMLPVAAAALLLVYVVGRRLGLARWAAALALLGYGLSPLSVTMMRQIYLDSFAVMWILAALALALSPRRHLWHYVGAGVAAGLAVLSKETIAIVLPAVVVAVWQSTRRTGVRPWAVSGFVSGLVLVGAFYPLYAAIKGELLPGDGHVSLIGALQFQLHERGGSGSAFTPGSNSNLLLHAWLYYDVVLPVAGAVAAVVALTVARLRAPAVGAILLLLMAVRPGGYLPAMYVVQALPFFAILLAGVIEEGARRLVDGSASSGPAGAGVRHRTVRWAVLTIALVGAVGFVGPRWYDGDRRAVVTEANAGYAATADWLRTQVRDPGSATVVTDDVLWIDLVDAGFRRERVIWFYKLDLDPAVQAQLPRGWRDVDYVLSTPAIRQDPASLPTVNALLHHSVTVASFGTGTDRIEVRRVNKEAS
jgi:4-amino-4-deoxy-L-arabinose transferase-like glycosyltransferase